MADKSCLSCHRWFFAVRTGTRVCPDCQREPRQCIAVSDGQQCPNLTRDPFRRCSTHRAAETRACPSCGQSVPSPLPAGGRR